MFKKKTNFAWNLYSTEAECANVVFQIQPPIPGVNFWNNMSIPRARVNMSEIEFAKQVVYVQAVLVDT